MEVLVFQADYGGNEEIAPLTFAFDRKIPNGYNKKIFFLTDGGIGTDVGGGHKAVVKCVKKNAHKAQLHTIGI